MLIYTPDGKTSTLVLDRDRFTLGRASTNELCYADDAGLSRQHLALERRGDLWSIRDLGSKNGTFVNGVRITNPQTLGPNDRITAGHLTMEFANRTPAFDKTVMFVEAQSGDSTSSTVISLDNVLETDKELAGAAQMRALIRAGRELAGHKSLSELFEDILSLSIEAVGASRGVLITPRGTRLVVPPARGEGLRLTAQGPDNR